MMKVVVLGPKFWKKLAKQYRKTNPFVLVLVSVSLLYAKPDQCLVNSIKKFNQLDDKPMVAKRIVSTEKPISWMGLRPQESMSKKDA